MSPRKTIPALLQLLRPHQWMKNILIFMPVLLANEWELPGKTRAAWLSFLCFSLAASAVYILNDWVDREADRKHPVKKNRPLASGAISPALGFAAMLLLLGISLTLARTLLPFGFFAVLLTYLAGNLLYSFWFKRVAILDVVFLTLMYVLRIIAGGQGTGIEITDWLLTISLFLFLSLAFGKRFQELQKAVEREAAPDEKIRGYYPEDLPLVRNFGQGSGLISVLVLALYINSLDLAEQYKSPGLLWVLCPLLLYGLGRFWIHAERGKMNSDPLKFVLLDWPSHFVFVLIILTIVAALRVTIPF